MKITTALAASSLALAGVAFVAPAAEAATFSCPSANVCIWTGGSFTGTRQAVSGYADWTDLNGSLHDQGSSWGSATSSQVMCVMDNVSGRWYRLDTLQPGERVAVVPNGTNDRSDAVSKCS